MRKAIVGSMKRSLPFIGIDASKLSRVRLGHTDLNLVKMAISGELEDPQQRVNYFHDMMSTGQPEELMAYFSFNKDTCTLYMTSFASRGVKAHSFNFVNRFHSFKRS